MHTLCNDVLFLGTFDRPSVYHWQGLLCINQSTNQLTVTFVGVTRVQKMNQKGSLGAGGYNM
jgi:hypothetical protein